MTSVCIVMIRSRRSPPVDQCSLLELSDIYGLRLLVPDEMAMEVVSFLVFSSVQLYFVCVGKSDLLYL